MSSIGKLFFVCCVGILVWRFQVKGANDTVHQELLEKLRDPSYSSSIRPHNNGGPVVVEVDLVLNSVGPVNETDMSWTASFYLRQEWTDHRLKLGGAGGGGGGGSGRRSVVKLREGSMASLWQPDLFFSNSKEGLRHQLTVPNRLLYVNVSDGSVLSSQRLTMVLNCKMDLVKFPHDHQTCTMVMESYSYTTEDLIFKWSSKRAATDLQPTIYIPDFDITSITTPVCNKTYAIGTFPCLQVTIKMDREIGYYICQTFLPTILIVILSWASFWIDHDAAPARVSVGLLTVLTITTQLAGSTVLLPKVPYIKAIDVWMSMNLVFVFAAYMEYPVVTVLSRRYRKLDVRSDQQLPDEEGQRPAEVSSKTRSPTTPILSESNIRRSSTRRSTMVNPTPHRPSISVQRTRKPSIFPPNLDSNDPGRRLDKKSRVLFPLSFAIFNIVYWVYYMV